MEAAGYPQIIWDRELDEYSCGEMQARGYARLDIAATEAVTYSLYFSDPVRLQQDLEVLVADGYPCFDEPGLVVIPEITVENIEKAVAFLWSRDFFSHLQPKAG